jgi:hypothetical protein
VWIFVGQWHQWHDNPWERSPNLYAINLHVLKIISQCSAVVFIRGYETPILSFCGHHRVSNFLWCTFLLNCPKIISCTEARNSLIWETKHFFLWWPLFWVRADLQNTAFVLVLNCTKPNNLFLDRKLEVGVYIS